MASSRQYFNLPGRDKLPFSDAVMVGDTLYLSGVIGLDANGKLPAKLEDEVNNLLDHYEKVLALAGMTMDDIVSVQVFAPDVSQWQAFNTEYVKRFTSDLPARAFLGSGRLVFNANFEMMGTAVRR